MSTPGQPETPARHVFPGLSRPRFRISLFLTLLGLLLFLMGARPSLFGMDRSPVVGFVQTSFFTVGLGIICLGGYIGLTGFWKNGSRTIAADIGSRLVATGFVIAAFAGMADVFGMGSHTFPNIPFFGPWQAIGVQVGQGIITVGFLLLLPFQYSRNPASIPQP